MPRYFEVHRPYEYIAYVDEAGDPGLRKIESETNTGASEWFILGCALIRRRNEELLAVTNERWRSELGVRQRDFIHYKDLNSARRLKICDLAGNNENVLFSVCSHKRNMEGYRNERAHQKTQDPNWFYNFMARVLFERVSDFVYRDSIKNYGAPKKIKIVFASRGIQRFSTFGAYIELLKAQTRGNALKLSRRKIVPDVLDCMLVSSAAAKENPGLQIADVVASAFFDAVNDTNGKLCKADFAQALAPRVAFERRQSSKQFADYGVVLMPTSGARAKISESQKAAFRFYGYDI